MPLVSTVRGYSPKPQILNEPKSLYQSPSGANGWDFTLLQPFEIRERDFALLNALE
jgi:hypothetical protein